MSNYGKRRFYGASSPADYTKHCVIFGPNNTCIINASNDLMYNLNRLIRDLIMFNKVREFRFVGMGRIDKICHEIVSEYKKTYKNIRRVLYVERDSWNKASHDLPDENALFKEYEEVKYVFTDGLEDRPTFYHRNNYLTMTTDIIGFYIGYDEDDNPIIYNKQELYSAQRRKKKIFFIKS